MGRKASLELRGLWVQRLKRQSASGLSIARFCDDEGISVNGFYAWKRRLKDARERSASTTRPLAGAMVSNGHAGPTSRGVPPRSPRQSRPTVSAGTFFQVPLVVGQHDERIEFVLVDGTLVRIPSSNLGAIELVLRTLAQDSGRSVSGGRYHA